MDAEEIALRIYITLFFLFPVSLFFGVIYYFTKYDELKKRNNGKYSCLASTILIAFISLIFVSGIAVCVSPSLSASRSKAREVSCRSNLKQISLALEMYSKDYYGFYPPLNGASGLEMLRSGGYLEDTRFYTCPNSERSPAQKGECLVESTVDYIYEGGYSATDKKRTAIVYDRDKNHKKYGNILYSDGYAAGFRGMNWKDCLINPSALKEEHRF